MHYQKEQLGAKEMKQKNKKYFALTFLQRRSWSCHALAISSEMWEKGLKYSQTMWVITQLFPVTLIPVGLELLSKSLTSKQQCEWGTCQLEIQQTKPHFLSTQTQMWYFGDTGVLSVCIHGMGLNPWQQAENKGWDFSISRVVSLSSTRSFLLPLIKILIFFSKMGGERVKTFRRNHRYKCNYALLIWVYLR